MRAKWRAFVDEYFRLNMNGTRAYKAVYGVEDDNAAAAHASRLVRNGKVAAEIENRLKAKQMAAEEVLARIAEQARGEYSPYFDDDGRVNVANIVKDGKAHLIKKIKTRTVVDGDELTYVDKVEFYDSQSALRDLARVHGLFKDQIEHSGDIRILVEYEDADAEAA